MQKPSTACDFEFPALPALPPPLPLTTNELECGATFCPVTFNVRHDDYEQVDDDNTEDTGVESVLLQYYFNPDYNKCSSMVVDGYLKKSGGEMLGVPAVIADLCTSFYYEAQNEHIHAAFQLYKETKQLPTFSGKSLVHAVTQSASGILNEHANQADFCDQLLRCNFIRIESYTSTISHFSSLFEANSTPKFEASDKYIYRWSPSIACAFESADKRIVSMLIDLVSMPLNAF